MWQGQHGPDALRYLQQQFDGKWKQKLRPAGRPLHWQLEFCDIAQVGGFGTSILDRALQLIRECDCALALHTPDERSGSDRSGNLWLEVGLWYALKAPERLLLVSVEDPSGKGAPPARVALPSDLGGQLVPRLGAAAKGMAELDAELDPFLEKQWRELDLQSSQQPAPYEPKHKVRDVLGVPVYEWLEQRMAECQAQHGTSCGCAEQSLIFAAELMRMGSSSWELAQLVHLLHQLALRATELQHAARARAEKMQALRGTLNDLTQFQDDVLRRKKGDRVPGKSWDRLTDFCKRRLELFDPPPRSDRDRVATAIDQFEDLASELMDSRIYNDPFFRNLATRSPLRETIHTLASDAKVLADYVADLHNAWDGQTQSFLDQRLRNVHSITLPVPNGPSGTVSQALVQMALMLGQASSDLPHNLRGGWKVPIWPRPQP